MIPIPLLEGSLHAVDRKGSYAARAPICHSNSHSVSMFHVSEVPTNRVLWSIGNINFVIGGKLLSKFGCLDASRNRDGGS